MKYAQAYSFKYSTRPGTPAADRPQVDEDVKTERLARLQALLWPVHVMADAGLTGQIVDVRVQGADTNSLSAVLA